jgi:hypothetical protein
MTSSAEVANSGTSSELECGRIQSSHLLSHFPTISHSFQSVVNTEIIEFHPTKLDLISYKICDFILTVSYSILVSRKVIQ